MSKRPREEDEAPPHEPPPPPFDLSEPYRPGVLVHQPQVCDAARRIAAAFGVLARLEDDADLAATLRKCEVASADLRLRLADAQERGDDAALVKNTEGALRTVERQLADARATVAIRFKRNVADALLRVTLLRDAAADWPTGGGGGGGAGASSSSSSAAAAAAAAEDDGGHHHHASGELLFVQAPTTVCAHCGNADETLFVHEYRSGDVTCARCGVVAVEHAQFDGDWTRSFEGEESSSQIGPRPDPLMSSTYNLRTGMALSAGVSKAALRLLRETADKADMLSMGNDLNERRTREAFKDKQKQRCFDRLQDVGERLRIATGVVDRAKVFFAAFRDAREHVTRLDESVACCLIVAVEEAVYQRMQADAHAGGGGGGGGSAAGAGAFAAAVLAPSEGASTASAPPSVAPLVVWSRERRPPPAAAAAAAASSAVGGGGGGGGGAVMHADRQSSFVPADGDRARARQHEETVRREAAARKQAKLHRVKVLDWASVDEETRSSRAANGAAAAASAAVAAAGPRSSSGGGGGGGACASSSSAASAARSHGHAVDPPTKRQRTQLLSLDGDGGADTGLGDDEDMSASKTGFERFSMVHPAALAAGASAAGAGAAARRAGAGAGASASSSSSSSFGGGGGGGVASAPHPTVSEELLSELYSVTAERLEVNPEVQEREEYKAV